VSYAYYAHKKSRRRLLDNWIPHKKNERKRIRRLIRAGILPRFRMVFNREQLSKLASRKEIEKVWNPARPLSLVILGQKSVLAELMK